ncbi:hypothetical protein RB195_017396 [Necator americanus]|uniref:Reverse transcriptase domain-containing protein n=1 Tax=Necator americanus TaxID=51031 RepID=A0ABR1C7F3_NECAM
MLNVPQSRARQTWIEDHRRIVGKKKDFNSWSECIAHRAIIFTSICRTLDEAYSQEQAASLHGFSSDHIQTLSRVLEVCRECRLSLVLTIVGYETFESVGTKAILSTLLDQGVKASYVKTLANYYDRCTTGIRLFHRLSPYLLGMSMTGKYYIAKAVHCCIAMNNEINHFLGEKEACVDGRFLLNLRFTDDIVLFSPSTNEAEKMLKRLYEEERIVGLQINKKKTQFIKNAYCEDGGVQLEGSQILGTSSYVYLGRAMNKEKT